MTTSFVFIYRSQLNTTLVCQTLSVLTQMLVTAAAYKRHSDANVRGLYRPRYYGEEVRWGERDLPA